MAEIGAAQWIELSPLLDELLEAQGEARAQRLARIRQENAGARDAAGGAAWRAHRDRA